MAHELQNISQFFRRFTIPPGLTFSQRRHAESFPALMGNQQFFNTKFLCPLATCDTLDKLSSPDLHCLQQRKRKLNERRKYKARSYEQEPWLQLDSFESCADL